MSSHTLYRFFDETGGLLYVGRTISPARRWREHERRADWFDVVASVTRVSYDTADAVDRAELLAITTEAPLHNVRMNHRPKRPATIPTPDGVERLLYRFDDAAARLGVDRLSIDRLVKQGVLESVKIGRSRLILAGSLAAYASRVGGPA